MTLASGFRIAVFQCDAAGCDKAERLARLARVMAELGRGGADLVVCPELYMSGYNVPEQLAGLAEPMDGPFARVVGELAREWHMAVVYGYPEKAGARRFNSAIAIGRDGRRLANHRKMALPPGPEASAFECGAGLDMFDIGPFKTALLVCYEAEFPETVRAVAMAGADLVVVPTALNAEWGVVAEHMIPTRAVENGVFIAYAGHAGREGDMSYFGGSCIMAPDGQALARAGGKEQVIVADLDPGAVAAVRARLPYLADCPALVRAFT